MSFRLRPLHFCGLAALACALPLVAAAARPPTDPAQFHYESLPAAGSVETAIEAGGPLFEFKSGRSAYRAFRLPDAERPYLIEIRSLLQGGLEPLHARVLYPVAALLTDDFLVSRQTELESLRFDLPVFEQAYAPAYRLTLGVDPAQGHERYLVVYTPASLLAPRVLPAATTAEDASQAARGAWLGAAPGGRLRITIVPNVGAPHEDSAP
ncbi:MAG: hypothetical protein WCH32_01815 [Pseudomonadota bacterium]